MRSVSSRPPSTHPLPLNSRRRQNTLEAIPFVQLLVELHEASETGTLLVHGVDGKEGAAVRAAVRVVSGEPVAALAEGCRGENLRRVLVALSGLTRGRFEFVEEHDLVGSRGMTASARIEPLDVVAACMRLSVGQAQRDRAVHAVGTNQLMLKPHIELQRYRFTPQERSVLAALKSRPIDLARLRRETGVSDAVLLPVISTLWSTRALALTPASRHEVSGAVTRRPPSATDPTRVSPLPRTRAASERREPLERSRSRRSPPREREAAHSTSSLPPLSDSRSLYRLNKARWDNIELMAQRGQYAEALHAANQAIHEGETFPQHEALLAWIIFQHAGAPADGHRHVWRLFERALRRDPLCEKALYYKALVLKRTGQAELAHAHFERLLLVNPTHVEAVREVRLHRMRRSHQRHSASFVRRLFSGPAKGKVASRK